MYFLMFVYRLLRSKMWSGPSARHLHYIIAHCLQEPTFSYNHFRWRYGPIRKE